MENVANELLEKRLAVMQRQLVALRWAVVGIATTLLVSMTWMMFRTRSVQPVLSAERLEIVEPDGKPAFVLANSQRPIAATIDGQQTMAGQEEERRGTPSITFFDGKGDEIGGMLLGVPQTSNGYSAIRHFSLDAYKQDQTVVLAHNQDASGSTSGLTISDRPQHSLPDAFRQLGLQPGASRDQLSSALRAIPDDQRAAKLRELFGTTRAFFGAARGREARVELRDGQGRVRIVLEAPQMGEPSLRFLDENGGIVLRLPR